MNEEFPVGTSASFDSEAGGVVPHTNASIAGPWLATGVVRRDSSLVVRYNVIMQLSDFEDGVYKSAAPLSVRGF